MECELRDLRIKAKLSQVETAKMFNMSSRTYMKYENEDVKKDTNSYKYMLSVLKQMTEITETKGILTIDEIKDIVGDVFKKYDVKTCILFGSYAKGKAKENSDIDLIVDTEVNGLKFFGMVEDLRNNLNKVPEVLRINQLTNNPELLSEVLKDGIRIFVR